MTKNDQCYYTSEIRVCQCKKVVMTQEMTNVMILVGLEFGSARRLS